jgi:hypothetical protein
MGEGPAVKTEDRREAKGRRLSSAAALRLRDELRDNCRFALFLSREDRIGEAFEVLL